MFEANMLANIFIGLMGLAVLLYAVLDGYDLGVGILLPTSDNLTHQEKADQMIASIGPFWDANETWLVLAVGLLLIAFPEAHSIILREMYIPATILLIALIMRGVAFDFRAKAAMSHQKTWDKIFKLGSILASLSQGYMLGKYITGFDNSAESVAFSLLSAVGVAAAYAYIGASWLVMKTEGELQQQAAAWGRKAGRWGLLGVISVSIVNPLVNPDVLIRWFSFPTVLLLLPLPIVCFCLFLINDRVLKKIPMKNDKGCWIPFLNSVLIFILCFVGLAYSFFPYIVPGQLTIYEAAAAPEALSFILWGALIVVPVILFYTAYSYKVFWGKATKLKYY